MYNSYWEYRYDIAITGLTRNWMNEKIIWDQWYGSACSLEVSLFKHEAYFFVYFISLSFSQWTFQILYIDRIGVLTTNAEHKIWFILFYYSILWLYYYSIILLYLFIWLTEFFMIGTFKIHCSSLIMQHEGQKIEAPNLADTYCKEQVTNY